MGTQHSGLYSNVWSGLIYGESMNYLNYMNYSISTLWSNEEGQDVAEYSIMLAVILVIVVGTVRLIGSSSGQVFSQVGSSIQ